MVGVGQHLVGNRRSAGEQRGGTVDVRSVDVTRVGCHDSTATAGSISPSIAYGSDSGDGLRNADSSIGVIGR